MNFILPFLLLTYYFFAPTTIEDRITRLLNKLPESTTRSIYISNANSGESIFEENINLAMIPASNTKLFTTATALNLMGPNHEFSTKILTDSIDNTGQIIENLYIKGYGNSTFNTKDLDSLVSELKHYGINRINGDIIGDDTYFDDLYIRDDWIIDERANVKLPPVSALVINKNQFVISLNSRGKIGTKLGYSIKPNCSFIDVEIKAKVTRNRSRPRIKATEKDSKIKVSVSGGLRKRRTFRRYAININNPPLYLSSLLKEKLEYSGIAVLGEAKVGIVPSKFIELASSGIRLDSLISLINKNSNNYLAECLFKAIGAFHSGKQGNSFYATQAIHTSFEEEDILDDETAIVDGSGISRFNTITTGAIVRLLQKVYKTPELYEDFYRSLAISGIDGTLQDRPISSFIKGNFHGKTGTLNGVTALSGYLTSKENQTYIISIIMEFKSRGLYYHKDLEDQILIELTK